MAMSPDTTYYTRPEHGGYPVQLVEGTSTLRLIREDQVLEFPNLQSLLRAVKPVRKGRRVRTPTEEPPMVEFLGLAPEPRSSRGLPRKPKQDSILAVQRYFRTQYHASLEDVLWAMGLLEPTPGAPRGEGIDLAKRGHEVRKLLMAGFGSRIARSGYDFDDVYQDICRGILARNIGKCPFDPKKSSFGHYVHLVSECILNNYHRKQQRIREKEDLGLSMRERGSGEMANVDAALAVDRSGTSHQDETPWLISVEVVREACDWDDKLAATFGDEVLPLLRSGVHPKVVAEQTGVSRRTMMRVLRNIQALE